MSIYSWVTSHKQLKISYNYFSSYRGNKIFFNPWPWLWLSPWVKKLLEGLNFCLNCEFNLLDSVGVVAKSASGDVQRRQQYPIWPRWVKKQYFFRKEIYFYYNNKYDIKDKSDKITATASYLFVISLGLHIFQSNEINGKNTMKLIYIYIVYLFSLQQSVMDQSTIVDDYIYKHYT